MEIPVNNKNLVSDLVKKWNGMTVAASQTDVQFKLQNERGYSAEMSLWLVEQGLIGWNGNGFAFPVRNGEGMLVGTHGKSAKGWYFSDGAKAFPFVVGNGPDIWVFESQWDAFAVLDRLKAWEGKGWDRSTVVITRGAGNGAHVEGFVKPGMTVFAFPQNDHPKKPGQLTGAETWVCLIAGSVANLKIVNCPREHKDWNDWTRAGATCDEIWEVINNAQPHEFNGSEGGSASEKIETEGCIMLPSSGTEITVAAQQIYGLMATSGRYFLHSGRVVEVCKVNGRYKIEVVTADGLRSRVEELGECLVQTLEGPKRARLSKASAQAILAAPQTSLLPPLRGLIRCPLLRFVKGKSEIVAEGYDPASGWYVCSGVAPLKMPLSIAIPVLLSLANGFDCETESDRSRLVASFIMPAMRICGIFKTRVPAVLTEANESQTGKTFHHELIAALYNERLEMVTQRQGGVGSTDESFGTQLIKGGIFILFDNFRGKFDSTHLEAFITARDSFSVRLPFLAPIDVNPCDYIVGITSNGLLLTPDLANRCLIVRIRKHKPGHVFQIYPEGSLLDRMGGIWVCHLSAIYAVITEWHRQGRPRTGETAHDFRECTQILDWIVQHILGLAPLLGGHTEIKVRAASVDKSMLRDLGLALEKEGRLGVPTSTSDLASLLAGMSAKYKTGDAGAKELGVILGRLFAASNPLITDEFEVTRSEPKVPRLQGGGTTPKKMYVFTRREAPSSK